MPPAPTPPPSKPQSPLRITHEGEFYARLLTRESCSLAGNPPSFRYYGEGTGAVPFVWESQPGTPKDAYSSSSSRMLAAAAGGTGTPAITPPPSYYLRGGGGGVPPLGHSARRHHHGKTAGGGRSGGKLYCGYKLKWPVKVGFIATVFRRLAVFGNKSRPSPSAAASVKSSSSSTRWLFSGSSAPETEARDQEYCGGGYDPEPRKTTTARGAAVLCLGIRASPWMVHFCSGGQREQATGWVYGWRP